MTLKGALNQLQELKDAEDMPMYFKPCLKEIIHTIQTDAQERKEGKWIHDIHYGLKLPEHRCSICGEWEYSDTESKYCPNCGAKMKGE